MSDREQFMYDVRVRDRFMAEGAISKSEVERHLAALVDVAEQCEELDLEQPALSKEPDESAVPPTEPEAPVAPAPERFAPVFASDGPQRPPAAPIPAIADPGTTTQNEPAPAAAPVEPVPAIAQEPAAPETKPAEQHGGPASVPPPTASVDADWGDS